MKTKERDSLTILYTESISGGFVGVLKDVPGVVSIGETIEELTENIKDAMFAMFASYRDEAMEITENKLSARGYKTLQIPAFETH
jgi:predicted RNase H-like HicB family nuclease